MYQYKAWIDSVYDGDTFTATVDLGFDVATTQTFRLLGINTPELRGGTPQSKAAGIAARDRLKELILGRTVNLISVQGEDSFGRWLAVVNREGENISVNQMLLDEGHALPYRVGSQQLNNKKEHRENV